MRHPVVRLIEAVRALRTYRSPSGEQTVVRFACGASEFPARASELHDALEAVDASGALTAVDDVDKMKRGLDAAVRWVSINGGDVKDFEQTILSAIAEKQKASKGYKLIPTFGRGAPKKKWRPETFRRIDRIRTIRKVEDLIGASSDIQAISESVKTIAAPSQDVVTPRR